MMTIAAICLGVTAIKHGFESKFKSAVQLILLAGVLDGLDGRVARLLKSDSKLGAELDSFNDVLNFGLAPPFVLCFLGIARCKRHRVGFQCNFICIFCSYVWHASM